MNTSLFSADLTSIDRVYKSFGSLRIHFLYLDNINRYGSNNNYSNNNNKIVINVIINALLSLPHFLHTYKIVDTNE